MALCVTLVMLTNSHAFAADRPNVVIIFADDMGYPPNNLPTTTKVV